MRKYEEPVNPNRRKAVKMLSEKGFQQGEVADIVMKADNLLFEAKLENNQEYIREQMEPFIKRRREAHERFMGAIRERNSQALAELARAREAETKSWERWVDALISQKGPDKALEIIEAEIREDLKTARGKRGE